MANNITFEVVNDGNVEQCRALCNELMAFQAARGTIHTQVLAGMNFENRLKPSFEAAEDKFLMVMKDDGEPVGYVYAAIDNFEEAARNFVPWGLSGHGFYPDWLTAPQKVGSLNNLYVRQAYRGTGAGKKLSSAAIDWMSSHADVKVILVDTSNGNDNAYNFYQKLGFVYSHDVAGGFIKCSYKKVNQGSDASA